MQDFPQNESGHDHFFATFGKFGAATSHRGKMLADVAGTAAAQNQSYLETMVSPASDGAKQLAADVGWDADLAALHRKLLAGGRLDQLVATAKQEADTADAEFRDTARCATGNPGPACRITVRWISQVSRNSAPERVFTQIALGLRLAERDQRFVAVNLVQPEDGEISLRDYRLHMRMLDYLHGLYPAAHITLHAGELVPGLVKPEDLTFHIDDAVRTGRAERIGHGVDLVHENGWQRLARDMARRQIAVEVPLTSNAQILQVEGDEHPFPVYRKYGVPVVLSTDDPGVSRGDIGQEYRRAARTYGLGYPELKDLSRASWSTPSCPAAASGAPTRYARASARSRSAAPWTRPAAPGSPPATRRPGWSCSRSAPSGRSRPATPAEPASPDRGRPVRATASPARPSLPPGRFRRAVRRPRAASPAASSALTRCRTSSWASL